MVTKVAAALDANGNIADWDYRRVEQHAFDAAGRRRLAARGAAHGATVCRPRAEAAPDARRRRRPQFDPALPDSERACRLPFPAGDAAAGLGAAGARRLHERVRDRKLHGRTRARRQSRSGRIPLAASRRSARPRRDHAWRPSASAGRSAGKAGRTRLRLRLRALQESRRLLRHRRGGRSRARHRPQPSRPRRRRDRQRTGGQSRRPDQSGRRRDRAIGELDAVRRASASTTRASPASTGRPIRSCVSTMFPTASRCMSSTGPASRSSAAERPARDQPRPRSQTRSPMPPGSDCAICRYRGNASKRRSPCKAAPRRNEPPPYRAFQESRGDVK